MTNDITLALHVAARDSMGMYPASYNGTPRTPWQEGWNAYGTELLDTLIKAIGWFGSLPLDKQSKLGEMSLRFHNETVKPYFCTSDLFAWGYSNPDELTNGLLTPMYEAWKKNDQEGMLILWCKLRRIRPQQSIESSWREEGLWDNELEALLPIEKQEGIYI